MGLNKGIGWAERCVDGILVVVDGVLSGVDGILSGVDRVLLSVDGTLLGVDRVLLSVDGTLLGVDGMLLGVDGYLCIFRLAFPIVVAVLPKILSLLLSYKVAIGVIISSSMEIVEN